MFQDRCTVAPDEIWVDIWDICFENEGNTSFVYTTCASAAVSDADVFFLLDTEKKAYAQTFGTCGGAWESNDYFFLALNLFLNPEPYIICLKIRM